MATSRDRYAQCDDTCTVDCGACKGAGHPGVAISLDLSDEQVDALVRVLRSVGGAPDGTGRQHTDSILSALEVVRPGCSSDESYPGDHDGTTTGSIYFSILTHPEEADS
jgi:hypothetical protein